jgi:TetR/AcrR family transcriptional regulator
MSTTAPQQRATDGNRVSLIKAAADAFADAGYEGASLRAIAEAAGVSYQLISHYFGNKEDLWRSTLEYLFERYLETGNGLGFDVSGNVRLQFRNHIRLLLTDKLQRPQIHKIWTQESFAASARHAHTIAQEERLLNELAIPYFREVARLGIVKKFTAEEISIVVAAVLQLNVVYPYPVELALGTQTGTAKSINRQVDLVFDLLTAGDDDLDEWGKPAPADSTGAGAPNEGDAGVATGAQSVPATESRRNDAELTRLRTENAGLKKVLAELLVQKAALHGKLRAAK